jgi:hypothetical protein
MFVFVHRKVKSDKSYSKEKLGQLVTDECKKYDNADWRERHEACMDGGEQAISCFVETDEKNK